MKAKNIKEVSVCKIITATVYEGKQLLLHLINTVWENFYSAFPTYHTPTAVAQIHCSITALYCCSCFLLFFRRFVSFDEVSLCNFIVSSIFTRSCSGKFFNHPLYPTNFPHPYCIPQLSTGRPLCPKIPLAITSPIDLSSSSSVIFQFILPETRWALATVHFFIFLSIASSNKTRNDNSGLTVFSNSACCKCNWARFEA